VTVVSLISALLHFLFYRILLIINLHRLVYMPGMRQTLFFASAIACKALYSTLSVLLIALIQSARWCFSPNAFCPLYKSAVLPDTCVQECPANNLPFDIFMFQQTDAPCLIKSCVLAAQTLKIANVHVNVDMTFHLFKRKVMTLKHLSKSAAIVNECLVRCILVSSFGRRHAWPLRIRCSIYI